MKKNKKMWRCIRFIEGALLIFSVCIFAIADIKLLQYCQNMREPIVLSKTMDLQPCIEYTNFSKHKNKIATEIRVSQFNYLHRHCFEERSNVVDIDIPDWFKYQLGKLIYAEGGNLNDEAQQYIGYVVLNRMRSKYFCNTFDGVLKQGYHPITIKKVNDDNVVPTEQCLNNAFLCLFNYYHETIPVPANLVFQAEFKQGTVYKKIANEYFCLDDRPGYPDN